MSPPLYLVDITKLTSYVAAFTDSADASYTTGICGEKLVALVSPPAFVSITLGANKILNPFTIDYDGNYANESNIGIIYAVQYSVSFKEYASVPLSPHLSTFNFEIKCPATVQSSTLTKPTEPINFYDVANPKMIKIKVPQIILVPGVACFTITGYEILNKKDLTTSPSFVSLSSDKLEFKVLTDDRKFVGLHVITLKALINSG